MFNSVIIEVHADLGDDAAESEIVSRFKESASALSREDHISRKEWRDILPIIDELRQRGFEIFYAKIGESIRIWLWCRTAATTTKLQKMAKDGRLLNFLIRLFSGLLKREADFKVKLSVASKQFRQAHELFQNLGNLFPILQIVKFFCYKYFCHISN